MSETEKLQLKEIYDMLERINEHLEQKDVDLIAAVSKWTVITEICAFLVTCIGFVLFVSPTLWYYADQAWQAVKSLFA